MFKYKLLKSLSFLLLLAMFSMATPSSYSNAQAGWLGDGWDKIVDGVDKTYNKAMCWFTGKCDDDEAYDGDPPYKGGDYGNNPQTDTRYQDAWQQEKGANITAFVNAPGDWFGEPVARSTIFQVAQRQSDVAHMWARDAFYIGAGCGVCLLTIMASIGKWKWDWFFMIVGGLFVIAGFQAMINFLN